jgi:hypothetical protein
VEGRREGRFLVVYISLCVVKQQSIIMIYSIWFANINLFKTETKEIRNYLIKQRVVKGIIQL